MLLLRKQSGFTYPIILLGIAIVYFISGKAGLSLSFVADQVTVVWPPTGIGLAAIFLFGYRIWPAIALGAFLTNITTNEPFITALGITIGNTFESIAGVWLFKSLRAGDSELNRVKDAILFVVFCAAAAPIISATIGSYSLLLGGLTTSAKVGDVWKVWWIGDAMGALVFAPFLLSLKSEQNRKVFKARWIEIFVACALLLAVSLALFTTNLAPTFAGGLAYILFPFIIWGANRLGLTAVSLMTIVLSLPAVVGTVGGTGPFATGDHGANLIALELFLGSIGITGLLLSCAIRERDEAYQALERKAFALRQTADELSRSNAELDRFALLISHDLQEPLQSLDVSVQMFARKLKGKLEDETSKLVDYIYSSSKRMSSLVKGLLELSRLQANSISLEPTDLNEVLKEVNASLRSTIEETGSKINWDHLPEVHIDKLQITRVFQNLISNAIKFRSHRPCNIWVTAEEMDNGWSFSVKDNGLGIKSADLARVFEPFARGEETKSLPGSGMGLAICKKVIELHGGEISANSAIEEGTIISFTIPKNAAKGPNGKQIRRDHFQIQ